jgi:hypothetical protein
MLSSLPQTKIHKAAVLCHFMSFYLNLAWIMVFLGMSDIFPINNCSLDGEKSTLF